MVLMSGGDKLCARTTDIMTTWTQGAMAQAGAGGGGGGGGGEDVPDIRFLVNPKEGQQGSLLLFEPSLEEREGLLVEFLQMHNVDEAELEMEYRVSDRANRQPPDIVALIARGSRLIIVVFRKRRHALFLMMMLRAYGGRKSLEIKVPNKYRNAAQLKGDILALQKQIQTLTTEIQEVYDEVTNMGGIPFKIPKVFEETVRLPKAK